MDPGEKGWASRLSAGLSPLPPAVVKSGKRVRKRIRLPVLWILRVVKADCRCGLWRVCWGTTGYSYTNWRLIGGRTHKRNKSVSPQRGTTELSRKAYIHTAGEASCLLNMYGLAETSVDIIVNIMRGDGLYTSSGDPQASGNMPRSRVAGRMATMFSNQLLKDGRTNLSIVVRWESRTGSEDSGLRSISLSSIAFALPIRELFRQGVGGCGALP